MNNRVLEERLQRVEEYMIEIGASWAAVEVQAGRRRIAELEAELEESDRQHASIVGDYNKLKEQCAALEADVFKFQRAYEEADALLNGAIRKRDELAEAALWALGYVGDFPSRQEGQGAYWWRPEFRKRCGEALTRYLAKHENHGLDTETQSLVNEVMETLEGEPETAADMTEGERRGDSVPPGPPDPPDARLANSKVG